jgi:hypothetical protein
MPIVVSISQQIWDIKYRLKEPNGTANDRGHFACADDLRSWRTRWAARSLKPLKPRVVRSSTKTPARAAGTPASIPASILSPLIRWWSVTAKRRSPPAMSIAVESRCCGYLASLPQNEVSTGVRFEYRFRLKTGTPRRVRAGRLEGGLGPGVWIALGIRIPK